MTFNPPVHILKYDSRPGVNRLVEARAIAKRVSILVHSDFIEEASRPTWHPFDLNAPVIKPFKTRIQSFASSERESSLYRVIYCFSSYREVHAALRSMGTLGSDDHEESQVPELWLESDYFSPKTNFCSTCGDQSHTRSSCEERETLPSVASVVAKITALLTALSIHLPEPSSPLLPSSA